MGGEDLVVKNEEALLRKQGYNVATYFKNNDSIDSAIKSIRTVIEMRFNRHVYNEVVELCKRIHPDIAHVHNITPIISSSVFYALKKCNVPIIQTLHNYRWHCACGYFFCQDRICHDCLSNPMKGVLKKCHKDSYLQSFLMTLAYPNMFEKVEPLIDKFIVLTRFQKELLRNLEIADSKLVVKPHFIPDEKRPKFQKCMEPYVVFVGRLEENKGILTLLKAFEKVNDIRLKIIGDGPLYDDIIALSADCSNIDVLGKQDNVTVLEKIAHAQFLLMPSELYETFGLTIIEAYACGTPVIASELGTRKDLVVDGVTGYLFEPGNAMALRNLIIEKTRNYPYNMPANCLRYFEERFSETQNAEYIKEIYENM